MIDQFSVDRATAFLLDVAEGNAEPDPIRVEAAQTVLGIASTQDCDPDALRIEAVAIEASERAVEAAFREGARWGRAHPRGGFPGRERVLDLVSEKLGAAS